MLLYISTFWLLTPVLSKKKINILYNFCYTWVIMLTFCTYQIDQFWNITVKFDLSVNNIFLTLKLMLHKSCQRNALYASVTSHSFSLKCSVASYVNMKDAQYLIYGYNCNSTQQRRLKICVQFRQKTCFNRTCRPLILST